MFLNHNGLSYDKVISFTKYEYGSLLYSLQSCIKLDIAEHPKTSHKLSKTIRKGVKVDSNNSLYSDTKKVKNILNENNVKITKQAHAFKYYAITYNVGILNFLTLNYDLKMLSLQLKVS